MSEHPGQPRDWSLSEPTVMARIEDALASDTPSVVATIVAVDGNGYRRPGAKMLVTEESGAGSITAGCIEDEVLKLAMDVRTSDEPRLVRFDLTDDDKWGLGLGCNGVIDLLMEPLDARFGRLVDGYMEGTPGLSLTLISGPVGEGRVRDRLYVPKGDLDSLADHPAWLDEQTCGRIEDSVASDRSELLCLSAESGGLRLFVDPICPAPKLFVFGSGNDVHPVSEFAKRAGFRVTVATFRGGNASAESFPYADRVVSVSAPRLTETLSFDRETYAVVMSHNFVDDRLAVECLLDTATQYIGIMGPSERFGEIQDALETERGPISDAELERLYAPIGLSLGGGEPSQIAMSIVSEVLAVHNDATPAHLRDRDAPIHPRNSSSEE